MRFRYIRSLILAGCLVFAQPLSARESNSAIKVSSSVDIFNKNVFRGKTYAESPVLQPSLTMRYRGFSGNLWTNINLKGMEFNEADYTFGHNWRVNKRLNLSIGYTFYTFPNTGGSNTQEIYLGAGLECLLSPRFNFYGDFDEGKGIYGNIAFNHKFTGGLQVTASLHYNGDYFRDKNGLSHCEARIFRSFSAKRLQITPILTFLKSLDLGDFNDEAYAGLNLSF